jgi:hypothetical protein
MGLYVMKTPSDSTSIARELRDKIRIIMAAKRQTTKRAASETGKIAASNGRYVRVHKPAETDPKKRAQAVREAGSIIKTTARIDTITLGRD